MRSLKTLLFNCAALVLPVAAQPTPASCRLTMSPTEVRGVTYRVALRLSPTCPASMAFRVRKSSTTSLKRNGAQYQPIRPLRGAWTVGKQVNTVPQDELFTLLSWEWQVYDPDKLDERTGQKGAWVRIPQDGRR